MLLCPLHAKFSRRRVIVPQGHGQHMRALDLGASEQDAQQGVVLEAGNPASSGSRDLRTYIHLGGRASTSAHWTLVRLSRTRERMWSLSTSMTPCVEDIVLGFVRFFLWFFFSGSCSRTNSGRSIPGGQGQHVCALDLGAPEQDAGEDVVLEHQHGPAPVAHVAKLLDGVGHVLAPPAVVRHGAVPAAVKFDLNTSLVRPFRG